MARFDVLFKRHIKNTDYKYNPNKSLAWNESNLKRMAFIENTCRTLYEKLDGTYGEDYAEYVITQVLQKHFTITGLDKYPLKEYKSVTQRVLMAEYLNRSPLKSDGNIAAHTLVSFYTSVVRELLSATKKGATVELYDFFICLGLMIEKWRVTEYPKYITKRLDDVETLLKQFVKHVVYAVYSKINETQNITLVILDKYAFEECLRHNDYSVVINKDTGERMKVTYDMYLSGLRMFFDLIRYTQNSQELVQPAIRTYAYASNKTMPEVLELIESTTGIDIGVIYDIFKNVNFDAHPQWIESPEYKQAFDKLEEIKSTKKNINYAGLKWQIREIFTTDYINYLNVVDKRLAYFLKEYELEKNVASYETVYMKKNYKTFADTCKDVFSEVTIDGEWIMEDCSSAEEFKTKLYKAVLDAQAINQMRVSLILPAGSKPREELKLNIKLVNISDELMSYAWSVMSEATEYLKTTYQLPFSFEITQRVFFRDKSRVCYLIL